MKPVTASPDRSCRSKMEGRTANALPKALLAWTAGLTLLLPCSYFLPAAQLFATSAAYLPIHTTLEFLAMAVSAMVFALGWNLRRQEDSGWAVVVAAASLSFALIDLAHTLSYPGMPDFVTPGGAEKAINFWLAGRLAAAAAFFAAALMHPRRRSAAFCNGALGIGIATALLVWWAGLYHAELFPRTFDAGTGLTGFKIGAEYFTAALCSLAAVLLFQRSRREMRANLLWLAASAWVFALSGLFFTLYRDTTDLFNLLGHIYMAAAYVMIYRAIFIAGVASPYEALARQQALLRSLIDSVPDLIFFKDRESAYLGFNAAFAAYCGRSEAEMLGRTDFDFAPATVAEFYRQKDREMLAEGEPRRNEEWIDYPDGRRVLLETLKTPYWGPDGNLLGIIGVSRDITARKQAEAALQESEERLRTIIDNAPSVLWIKDLDGRFQVVNRQTEALLGLPKDRILGRTLEDLRPPAEAEAHTRNDRAVLAAGEAREFEETAQQGDGPHTYLSVKFPLRNGEGRVYGLAALSMDITKLRAAEASLQAYRDHLEELVAARTRELEEARAEAERLSRVKSDFLANMSHEIRTPLNAILGFAQIGERQPADPRAGESFRRILDSGRVLLGIINDILDFSKIEAGKLSLERGVVDLGQVIDYAVDLIAPRAAAKGLDFRIEEAADLPATCQGDSLRLSQVLLNLLTNAVKFTEEGSIVLGAGRQDDDLVFRIADTGIGMDPQQVGRLFSPFEQADSSTTRRFGGTGLGLTICKRLVELMGGSIRVDSRPGQGSAFEIRLPQGTTTPSPAPQGALVVFSHFPPEEARELIGALRARGAKAAKAAEDCPFPAPAALTVLPAEALDDLRFRQHLDLALAAGHRVAVVEGKNVEPGGPAIDDRAIILQRPIRPRQILAKLSALPADNPPPLPGAPRLAGLTLLAAEDNPINRMVLEDILALEGARLVCLEDGRQALERLRQDGRAAYDLVLTDVQMPNMDGYELAGHIRDFAPDLPVIGLTAHAMAEERDRCLAAGMVEHVAKPIDLDQLVAVIRRHSRRLRSAGSPGPSARRPCPAAGHADA